jgi:integrase
MATTGRQGKWPGGYIRHRVDGDSTYYLHKRAGGVRPNLPVGSTKREAEAEYRAFLADPAGWLARRKNAVAATESGGGGLYLTTALIDEFKAHCLTPRDNRKPNSERWTNEKAACLDWWTEQLADRSGRALDLKQVRLAAHIIPALEVNGKEIKGARHKREAIKSFYAWLRRRGKIAPDEDPVAALPVGPGGKPALATGKKRVPSKDDVAAVLKDLLSTYPRYGHALAVSAATGWHDVEISRFASSGAVLPVPKHLREDGADALLFLPLHKSGKQLTVKISAAVAVHANALIAPVGGERAGLNLTRYREAVEASCEKLKLKVFHPAWLRHTRSTKAMEAKFGEADVEATRKALGHAADSKMLEQIYAYGAVGPFVPGLLD